MRLLYTTLLASLLVACGPGQKTLPAAGGAQGEVLVVMANGHWEGEPGAALRSILEQAVDGLPQREPRFSIAQVPPEGFGQLLSVHHSVVLALVGQEADSTAISYIRNRHARGQVLVQLAAKDPVEWIGLVQRNGDDIFRTLEDQQRTIVMQRLVKERDKALVAAVQEAHQVSMDIPGGYRMVKQAPGFSWLQRDRIMSGSGLEHNVIEGLLIHTHPYSQESAFTVDYLIDQRDSVTRAHVDGPNPGTYMVVQRSFEDLDLRPVGRALQLDGRYNYYMQGLFGMHGAKMGGPFVSLTTIDEARGRVITVEGFTYAPQFNKREYIREQEGILFSLRIDPGASR